MNKVDLIRRKVHIDQRQIEWDSLACRRQGVGGSDDGEPGQRLEMIPACILATRKSSSTIRTRRFMLPMCYSGP